MATKKRKPSEQQTAYVANRARGLGKNQSAILANYAAEDDVGTKVEKSATVQAELTKIRAETAANTGVTKEEVVQMLLDAAQMAKVMADPTGMVAAARELGKMLGYYAPEVKKNINSVDKDALKAALQEMTDDDLFKLAHARTIDVECKRLDAPNPEKV